MCVGRYREGFGGAGGPPPFDERKIAAKTIDARRSIYNI